ncbi:hypothetical protein INQ51_10815 [Maribellus sp. CM-23]|uniref:sialate O-acetylesterase n=1 Tax=Maribellus sp. CM-23 TaxID=2781026 RepID=UPI001F1DFDA2|nr:sialate O-acetylesterase [Maribellus sp. CM-23]MCE4564802.1 hypothetical protein [Maribellus sp. CM-23]
MINFQSFSTNNNELESAKTDYPVTIENGTGPKLAAEGAKHLFILAGQSNMEKLNPGSDFTPAVGNEFGFENIIVVKFAVGGTPIRRRYRDGIKPKNAQTSENKADKHQLLKRKGDLYDSLITRVNAAIEGHKPSVRLLLLGCKENAMHD